MGYFLGDMEVGILAFQVKLAFEVAEEDIVEDFRNILLRLVQHMTLL